LRGKKTTTSPRSGTDWTPTSGSTVFHFRFGGYGAGRGDITGDGRFGNGTGIPFDCPTSEVTRGTADPQMTTDS